MAVGILFVLSITLAAIIQYTSSNERNARYSQASQSARSLAEAGINNALAVLFNAPDPSVKTLLTADPLQLNPPVPRISTYEAGTVSWAGRLHPTRQVWQLTATGIVRNPTGPGAAPVRRALTVNVPLPRIVTQPN